MKKPTFLQNLTASLDYYTYSASELEKTYYRYKEATGENKLELANALAKIAEDVEYASSFISSNSKKASVIANYLLQCENEKDD